MVRNFDVVVEKDHKTHQFYASVPTLPGCYSYGDSMDELRANIKEAIELHLDVLKEKKIPVKDGSVVGLIKVSV
ncbi:MAG: type II toxin-antitoxin system HicB family antitoxin [Candidatus Diapherotrites archaeon]|nr:type II toxin-antitoxin system HicB family antitoxin [Candidatus Diapherotrites archaeon]